jgi:hypothetical protein
MTFYSLYTTWLHMHDSFCAMEVACNDLPGAGLKMALGAPVCYLHAGRSMRIVFFHLNCPVANKHECSAMSCDSSWLQLALAH